MSSLRSLLSAFTAASLLALAPLQGAFAFEADEIGESLRALLAHQNVEASWSGIEDNGTSITLQDLTLTQKPGDGSVSLGDVTMDGISDEDDHYRVGEISLPSYEQTFETGLVARLYDLDIEGLILPKDIETDPLGGMMRYDQAEIGTMFVARDETQLLSIQDFSLQMMQPDDNGGTLEAHGSAETITVALAEMVSPEKKAILNELGYGNLSGTLDTAGSWRPSDGRLMLSQFSLSATDAGTFGITLDLSGYTPEFVKSMRRMAEQMENASKEQMTSQGFAMLGLAQQLNFHGAMLRFDDDSLTGKVVDYVADKQGMAPEDVVRHAGAAVRKRLSPYLGNELAGEVSEAVDTFLTDPRSLEIRAEPGDPVPFAMIMGAVMTSPKAVRDQLGVDIIANGDTR